MGENLFKYFWFNFQVRIFRFEAMQTNRKWIEVKFPNEEKFYQNGKSVFLS